MGGSFEIATNGLWIRGDVVNEGTFTKTSSGETTLALHLHLRNGAQLGLAQCQCRSSDPRIGLTPRPAAKRGSRVTLSSVNRSYRIRFVLRAGNSTGAGIVGGGLELSGDAQISPGSPNGSPGILIVTNTFSSVGINLLLGVAASDTNVQLNIDVGGPVAGTGFDQVVVYGNANVQGADFHLVNGYVPNLGDTFQVLKCAKLFDQQFGVVNGTAIAPGKAFKVNDVTAGQNPAIVLEVVSLP